MSLRNRNLIRSAFVLDIDLHYGDGTVDILGKTDFVSIHNPQTHSRKTLMNQMDRVLAACQVNIIGISAGFDYHQKDWGGVLTTQDYFDIGQMVRRRAHQTRCGCFAILEGGYNHEVLGHNVLALIQGLSAL